MSTAHATASHDDHSHDDHEDGDVHAHISDWKFLAGIFITLIFLTVVTVLVSYVDLGFLNMAVAMLVATMKATLVATFFMHLRYDKLFNTIAFLSAFLFLGVFFMFSYDDLSTRGRVDDANGVHSYNGTLAGGRSDGTEAVTRAYEQGQREHAAGAHGGGSHAAPAAGGSHGSTAAPASGGSHAAPATGGTDSHGGSTTPTPAPSTGGTEGSGSHGSGH